jgi:uncharacterized membrane protein (DUF485 family)
MSRPYIPILAFLLLLLLTIPFSFDFETSVIPGWHTTIYPPYFIGGLFASIVLLLATIGYWLLSKQTDKINWILFSIHLALTIPAIIFIRFPTILINGQVTSQDELIKTIQFQIKMIPIAWTIFIIGQILFLIYYMRAMKTRRTGP